jgi:hypothetical protein
VPNPSRARLALDDQRTKVERVDAHGQLAVRSPRPFRARAVDHQFEPVAVGVIQIDSEVHAMIGCAQELVARAEDPEHNVCQRLPAWKPQGEVMQPGRTLGWRLSGRSPDVERHVMVVVTSGKKRRFFVLLGDGQTDDVAVKAQRPLEIKHTEVDMADLGLRRDRCGSLRQAGHVRRGRQTALRMAAQRIVRSWLVAHLHRRSACHSGLCAKPALLRQCLIGS